MVLSKYLTLVTAVFTALAFGQTCYNSDRTTSEDNACGFQTDYCCPSGDTCVTQGLCQDKNNHLDGTLTLLSGAKEPGPYNYTGLYKTATCTNVDWPSSDCKARCPLDNGGSSYVWACNDELTSFCCSTELAQRSCCNGTTWSLSDPPLALNASLRPTSSSAPSNIVVVTFTMPDTNNATSFASTTPGSSATLTSTTPGSSATPTSSGESGLSSGAQAGIGVGIGACVLVAAIVGFIFWRRRKTRTVAARKDEVAEISYLPDPKYTASVGGTDYQTGQLGELSASPKPAELPMPQHKRHEMP